MAPPQSTDHLLNGERSALLHRLIHAADRLPSVGGSLHTWGVGAEPVPPDAARSQDMAKVVSALRLRTAGSSAKLQPHPGVFTPRLAALLSAPSAAPMASTATAPAAAGGGVPGPRPSLTASALAAGRMCYAGGGRPVQRSLRTSSSMGLLASGSGFPATAPGAPPAVTTSAMVSASASAAAAASPASLFPAGTSVQEMQALQEEEEALAAAMAAARPHAASLALRWLEGSATPAATAAFLGSHPLFQRLSPAQVRRLASDARFVCGSRYGTVYREGAPVDRPAELGGGIGILLQGTALLHAQAGGGLHRRVGVAEWVGEGCLVSARLPRLHCCEWLSAGIVLMLPLDAIKAAAQVGGSPLKTAIPTPAHARTHLPSPPRRNNPPPHTHMSP